MLCVRKCAYGLLFVIGIIEIAGISALRHYDAFYRTIPVENFDALETFSSFSFFQKSSSPQKIMQQVMNSVSSGKNCNGMSELFLHALRLQGYKARKLFVVKSIGDPAATHTLVEVYENDKWVVYDPTFNVSFERDGQLLGATDIAKSLLDGSFKAIKPLFYGEVAYKARLETYPIYWLAHFNNVLLFKYGKYSSSWFIRNTFELPLRYWQGPVLYYFAPSGTPNRYLELLNWLYFFLVCIGPLLFLFLSLICLALLFIKILKNKRKQA